MNDLVLKFNVEGVESYETEKLTGELKAIIIQSNGLNAITILSEYGYTIYNNPENKGSVYYPIRTFGRDELGHIFREGESFYLNEKLNILVNGQKGTEVILILRFS